MKGFGDGGRREQGQRERNKEKETFAQCSKVNQFSKFSTGRKAGYYCSESKQKVFEGEKQNYHWILQPLECKQML